MERINPHIHSRTSPSRSPLAFFVLVYALTIPFWLLGTFVQVDWLPDNLPITDVGATFVPMIAAFILVHRTEGGNGVKKLCTRVFDFRRIPDKRWYVPIVLLLPLLYLLTYLTMRNIGLPVPNDWHVPLLLSLIFIGYFIAATGEELGYMGYVIDPVQERMGALAASVVVGSIWALWHFPSMILIGQSPRLMAWGFVATVGFRILYVWLYNNTSQCIFGVILFHAIGNTGRTIFPGGRQAFELADAAVGYSLIAASAMLVAYLWAPRTFARFRFPFSQRK